MNRIINTLALATAGLVLLCGCSADPATDEAAPGGNDGKTVPVSFAAELPATRATIEIGDDRFNGAWEVDIDKLGIHATLNGVAQINKPFVFSSEGIFKGELTPGTGAWTYLAYYPHGEQSLNGTSATIPFGNTRIQKGGTYNSLFDILIAPAQTTANSAEGVDDSGERIRFNMQRLTSILDFDLTNSTSDPIRCVLLTAESDDFLSAKSLNFDLAQGEAAAPALDTEERSKSILINFDGGSASAAAQLDAFFNVLPGNYNLNLDIITATKQMASVKIDRTDKPFEAGVLYKKEVGTCTAPQKLDTFGVFFMKYNYEIRLKAVKLVLEGGLSVREAGCHLGCGRSQVHLWVTLFERHGLAGLKLRHGSYSAEFKLSVLKHMHQNHLSLLETAVHFGIPGPFVIRQWERLYQNQGAEGLRRKPQRRRPAMSKSKTKKVKLKTTPHEELLKELEYLRAENAYLKKLQALVEERIVRESGKEPKPSKD